MPSLKYLRIDACSTNAIHPIWQDLTCSLSVRKASIKAQLLTQRYPLTTCHTAGNGQRKLCPLCEEDPEDTVHFLLHCQALAKTRYPYLVRILNTCRDAGLSVDPETVVSVVLDSNHLPDHYLDYPQHEELCRNFVYKLHHRRSLLLGGMSAYIVKRDCQ